MLGVIFDFDGVIADSEGLHFRAFQRTLEERGSSLTERDYYDRYLGFADREVFDHVARARGEVLSRVDLEALVAAKGRTYASLIAEGPALCNGAADAIHRLSQHFPLGIASAAFGHEIVQVLETAGLRSSFKTIVGVEDVAESKPSPAPYLEAAKRLGVPPASCVAIEDSPWGLESALRAGLKAIGVTHTYRAPQLAAAHVVIDSLDALTESFVRGLFSR
jgi:beta-phosphoglucomutase